nr:T cell receptor beta [Andrias davidianus]
MQGTCLLFALTLLFHYGRALSIDQRPRFLSLSPGKAVRIECSVQGYANPNMYWYRKFPKKPFEMMFLSRGKDMVDDSPEKHFSASRTTSQDFILETQSVSLNDTAEYYCARDRVGEQYFGAGTKLTVLEKDVPNREPNVVLFDPSPLEISQKKKATLVCLATNFYPGYVTLTWSVNGKNRTEGVKTDDDAKQDGGSRMYSLSSRLRLSMQEWFNARNSFQCTVHMYHPDEKDVQRTIMGQEGCGLSEESYRRHATSAKFTYILFLCKAALYGFIVTVLVWRFKGSDKQFT